MAEKLSINMDSLLDGTLDQLADRPEFKAWPIGAHKGTIKWEVADKVTIKLHLTAIESIELSNPNDTENPPLEKGTETTVQMKLDNEYGQGDFKEMMKCLAVIFGADKTNRQLMDLSSGGEFILVTDQRQNKEKTATYTTVKAIAAVSA